jgi:FAD/FMN-containing dehydrogenase/Fe-S oxidoreductase
MAHVLDIDHARSSRAPERPASARRVIARSKAGRIITESAAFDAGAVRELARRLAETVKGDVGFDASSRALHATDASNYRQTPIGVVAPRSAEDIAAVVDACREADAPIVMRGGGTSLAGQGCNVAIMIDCSKYFDHVLLLDPHRREARVEPGCILDTLRNAAERHQLTFGPDPATHDHNTLGGMIGNNSCGVHSVMAGRTSDNVEMLDVVTYDGLRMTVGPTSDEEFRAILDAGGRRADIYRQLDRFRRTYGDLIRARYPQIPRRVSGYENLDQLLPENGFNVARALTGTEGTCVAILSATLSLVPSPQHRVLAAIGFTDVFAAADAVPEALRFAPVALEGIDDLLVKYVRDKHLHEEDLEMLPAGESWLVAEFGGETVDDSVDKANRLIASFARKGNAAALLRDPSQQARLWAVREAALGATAHVPGLPESHPGWEDSAVHRESLGDYLREFKALLHQHGYEASLYGHFGDGLVHCRIDFDLSSEAGLRNWSRFLEEAADLVARYGGSLSGEHGDGQARAALLERVYGRELVQAFREFKAIWDPRARMNPGKIVDPYPITSNLRLGPDYRPPEIAGRFAYTEDGGSFTKATRRCVGVGSCRRRDSSKSVMCPSYMATGEEKYSTRGRARLLFEMLEGDAITDGWASEAVEDALNLCLGCKGCKSDCPVHVDMATYKAEFRSRHYENRWRPRAAYTMGRIHRWARLASHAPALANLMTQTPGLSALAKWAGGIAPQRTMPAFARQSFVRWFRQSVRPNPGGQRVMLWPDTFTNYFRPGTAVAATRVLERLGFAVAIPRQALCCGRPLYDWGFLDEAKTLWRRTLTSLAEEIAAGTPIIGLEPACVSAFRDELVGLFPRDEAAQRLSRQTLFFTEFLDQHAKDAALPKIAERALVQVHCHHHAVIKPDAEKQVLERLGIDYEVMPSGCCGMAGAFGFEADKYDVSMQAAGRVLLPRVAAAPESTAILADGFSCREQIEQGTGRTTAHIAELIWRHMNR